MCAINPCALGASLVPAVVRIQDLFHVCIGVDNNNIPVTIDAKRFYTYTPTHFVRTVVDVYGKCYRIVAVAFQFNQYCIQIYAQINFNSLLLNAKSIVIKLI